MKKFGLIGAAGYIAPRHMKAIQETGNDLVVATDVSDSVGIIDSYFPEARFFTDFEQFDAHVHDERRLGRGLDFVSVASPNYLHYAHMQWAFRAGANVICEKPIVLDPQEITELENIEAESGQKVYTVLQLRLHPSIIELRNQVVADPMTEKYDVDLTYVTSRGNWYLKSWKNSEQQSGGIAANIGVHFFDMLHFVYGRLIESIVHLRTPTKAAGYLEYELARVRWFLSIDIDDVPAVQRQSGKRTYRAFVVNGKTVEFSDGFTDLHTKIYDDILGGGGFGLEESRTAIETVAGIRTTALVAPGSFGHPLLRR